MPCRITESVGRCQRDASKESVKAKLRVIVRRILKRYGYPPDKQTQATITVLRQAEAFGEWLAA